MPNTIDTVEDGSQVSSVLEVGASELLKTRQLNSRFPAPRRKPLPRWVFAGLGLMFAAMAGFLWWLHVRHFESTDDAQIDGHINVVSSRVSGTVLYVNPQVENNQYVEAGTLLLELDPNDYKAALEHAKSDLAAREGEARSAGVNVPITNASAFSPLRLAEAARDEAVAAVDSEEANLAAAQHRVKQDEAVYTRAERDRVRYQGLVDGGVVSRLEYDAHEAEALADSQALEADRATVISEHNKIGQLRSLVEQKLAQVQSAHTAPQQVTDAQAKSESSIGQVSQAKADVRTAELNLGYTKIYAPVSGVIGRKSVELGQRIQPGQSLLAIVPLDDIWVTADFKETQLKYMRAGEPVSIHVDTFGRDYKGTVEIALGKLGRGGTEDETVKPLD